MRAVRRSAEQDDIVQQFTDASRQRNRRAVFATMREFMCFAATLGFDRKVRKALSGQRLEIDGRIFANSQSTLDLMYLLALAELRRPDILRDENEDEMVTVFEEYANGGFDILRGWLSERPDDPDGHEAILTGLAAGGYLAVAAGPSDAGGDVEF